MTKTMRKEKGTDPFLLKFLERSLFDQPQSYQVFYDRSLGKKMHVIPFHSGLRCRKDWTVCIKDSVVDPFLLLGEFAGTGEGDCDVRAIIVVLIKGFYKFLQNIYYKCAHVTKHQDIVSYSL